MTHILATLLHLDMQSAWEVTESLAFLFAWLIALIVIVNWPAIRRFGAWLLAIASEVMKAHDEWERSLTPEERAYLAAEEVNLFI